MNEPDASFSKVEYYYIIDWIEYIVVFTPNLECFDIECKGGSIKYFMGEALNIKPNNKTALRYLKMALS